MKDDTRQYEPVAARLSQVSLFTWASFAGLATAFIFVGFAQLDIAFSRLFVLDNGAFVFNYPGIGPAVRDAFQLVVYLAFLIATAGLAYCLYHRCRFLALSSRKWLFLVLCLAVGPGLMANTVLKDNWGRARPLHIEEFGGPKKFTPVLAYTDQCERNCSFISGEAASGYMLFFALAMLFRRTSRSLIGAGILTGLIIGLIRVAQGGHFLSDIIFAGVFMALLVKLLSGVVFAVDPAKLRNLRLIGNRRNPLPQLQFPTRLW